MLDKLTFAETKLIKVLHHIHHLQQMSIDICDHFSQCKDQIVNQKLKPAAFCWPVLGTWEWLQMFRQHPKYRVLADV